MADIISDDRTQTSAATSPPAAVSRTRTIDELVDDAGFLRIRARLLGDDLAEASRRVGDIHRQAFRQQIDAKARQLSGQETRDMLVSLADRGFAWRDIARLVGVSVPALRRWRQGESPTGDHRLAIARLVALVELLQSVHLITEVASWMEMPLSQNAPVTGIDLAATGRYEDLLDLAANHASPEEVLERWQPDWRERYRSDFEIFDAPDGQPGIRPTTRESSVETRNV